MNESILVCVSGRCMLNSLRPSTLSKEDTCGEVGEVFGDDEGEIFVLILVVRVRRIAMLIGVYVDYWCWHVAVSQ
jgi:hypothetical protein